MRKKDHNKKSFFRRKRQSEPDDEIQFISNDELFEDAADYDEEDAESEEEPAEDFEEEESPDYIETAETEGKEDSEKESGSEEAEDDPEAAEGEEPSDEEPEEERASEEGPEKTEESEKDSKPEDEPESGEDEELPEDDYAEEDIEPEDEEGPEGLEDDEIKEMNLDEEDEDREPTEAEIAFKKHRRRKKILIAMASIIGVLAAVYLGVSAYFYSHFYYNTKINGADVSLNTVSQVQEYMEGEVAGYSLTLAELGGKEESILGTDISLKYVKDDSLDKLLKDQNPFLWVTAFWQPPEIEASVGV